MTKEKDKAYKVGTVVKSAYRSPWKGIVVASGRDFGTSFNVIRTVTDLCNCITCGKGLTNHDPKVHLLYNGVPVDCDGKTFNPYHGKTLGHPKRKPWGYLSNPSCVFVKITHDKNGNPMRKVRYTTLHSNWLTEIK